MPHIQVCEMTPHKAMKVVVGRFLDPLLREMFLVLMSSFAIIGYGPMTFPMLRIMHLGPPPILDKLDYPAWVFRIKPHIKSSSEELW